MKNRKKLFQLAQAVCFVLTFALVWSLPNVSRAADPKEIVIGSSVSRTGPGAPFGIYAEWGHRAVVDDVNKKGGIYMSKYKKKLPVRLVLYDDESVPDKAVQAFSV